LRGRETPRWFRWDVSGLALDIDSKRSQNGMSRVGGIGSRSIDFGSGGVIAGRESGTVGGINEDVVFRRQFGV
jgi:hypothetical protein